MAREETPKKAIATVIGVIEKITLRGPASECTVTAKVDTGAQRTTIDTELAKTAGLGPVLRQVRTRAAAADNPEVRDVVKATLIVAGQEFKVNAAITDRKDMRYPVIIGMDILAKSGFHVDPGRPKHA